MLHIFHNPSRSSIDVSLTFYEPSVAHVGIAVTSIAEALAFIATSWDFRPDGQTPSTAPRSSAWISRRDIELLGPAIPTVRGEVPCEPRSRHPSHLYRVSDLDAALEAADAAINWSMRPPAGAADGESLSCTPRARTHSAELTE